MCISLLGPVFWPKIIPIIVTNGYYNKESLFIEFEWIISFCPTLSEYQYSYIVPQELERLHYKKIIIGQLEGEMSSLWLFASHYFAIKTVNN